jgi:hypothetical protein
VDYATADGTAQAGRDYQALSGTLEFKENETVKSLTIPILPGALAASSRSFNVMLNNPTGGASWGATNLTLSGSALALDEILTGVVWTNTADKLGGLATGSNAGTNRRRSVLSYHRPMKDGDRTVAKPKCQVVLAATARKP